MSQIWFPVSHLLGLDSWISPWITLLTNQIQVPKNDECYLLKELLSSASNISPVHAPSLFPTYQSWQVTFLNLLYSPKFLSCMPVLLLFEIGLATQGESWHRKLVRFCFASWLVSVEKYFIKGYWDLTEDGGRLDNQAQQRRRDARHHPGPEPKSCQSPSVEDTAATTSNWWT